MANISFKSNKYKDIKKYREIRNAQKQRYRDQFKNAGNANRWYTPEEDRLILAKKVPDRELAKKLDRTVSAIQLRRNRLKNGIIDTK